MQTNSKSFGIACRIAAFSFLMAGTASLLHAQQAITSSASTPVFLASSAPGLDLAVPSGEGSSSSSSSSDDMISADGHFNLDALGSTQPPPRRYGRPNYSDSHNNADGSSKYTFMAGAGASVPIGNTEKYDTPSWDFQVGGGRNFNKSVGVLMQFDYDHFGLQGSNLANQQNLYNYGVPSASQISGLDGNSHVWSFTLDPTFTLPTEGALGAYAVGGVGYYHKVTDFTLPTTGTYCDYFYGCYQYQANQVVDHYSSNAAGVNGGLGLTYKFSQFSNERFYVEARYVVVFNPQRVGLTAANVNSTFGKNYTGYNFYPANSNRTTYIPITFGIRF